MDSYIEFERDKLDIDLTAVKWYAQELIDASYNGPMKRYLFDMESIYRASYRIIIGYIEPSGKYVPGYLDAPFWGSVEEGLVSCIQFFKDASIKHPDNRSFPAVVDAASNLLEYLNAGEV